MTNSMFIICIPFCFFQLVKAHKLFLVMGSPVFEAMFFGGMAQANAQHQSTSQGDTVEILDIQPSTFKDLIE